MRRVLLTAIEHKGSSVDTYKTPEGQSGSYQNAHVAYGRAGLPCTICRKEMLKMIVAGRGTTICPRCQRPARARRRRVP